MNLFTYFKKRKQLKEEKRKKQTKSVRILKTIGGTIVYILVVLALVWGTPKALTFALGTQYPMAAITSGSMWPALKKGDLVFIQGVDAKAIKVGDIVVYTNQKDGTFTIHRVVELRDKMLLTKGDANNITDEPIGYEAVIGRLYKIGNWNARIPKLGFISIMSSGKK